MSRKIRPPKPISEPPIYPEEKMDKNYDVVESSSAHKKRAEALYLAGYDVIEISAKMCYPIETIRRWAYGVDGTGTEPGCWEAVKRTIPNTSVIAFITSLESKIDFMTRGVATCADIMVKTLGKYQRIANDPDELPLTTKELKAVADVFKILDESVRLDSGKPTSISEVLSLSFEQQAKISEIVGDQLSNIVDAEFSTPDNIDQGGCDNGAE